MLKDYCSGISNGNLHLAGKCVSNNHKDDYHARGCGSFQCIKDKIPPIKINEKTLDSSTVHDLLNIMKLGNDRMEKFICQYILPLPTTGPWKQEKKL